MSDAPTAPPAAIVVMGVSGSGKSTIAAALAERLGGLYLDADDFHSDAARAQMSAGRPLTDDDRAPWLVRVGERIRVERDRGTLPVVACSALRRRYRDALRDAGGPISFVHLDGGAGLVAHRLSERTAHFMSAALLASQYDTLEPLEAGEDGFEVDISRPVPDIVEAIVHRWLVAP
jgi:gluconokinase